MMDDASRKEGRRQRAEWGYKSNEQYCYGCQSSRVPPDDKCKNCQGNQERWVEVPV
jgi:uncharacterized OB-fold protein